MEDPVPTPRLVDLTRTAPVLEGDLVRLEPLDPEAAVAHARHLIENT